MSSAPTPSHNRPDRRQSLQRNRGHRIAEQFDLPERAFVLFFECSFTLFIKVFVSEFVRDDAAQLRFADDEHQFGCDDERSWQNYLAEDHIEESATAIGAAWRLNGRRTYCLRYHCREALLSVQAQ